MMKRFKLLIIGLFILFSFIGFGYCVDLSVPGGSVEVFHLTSDGYSTEYTFPSSYKFMFYNLVDASSNKFGGYCGYSSRSCSFSPTSIMNSITINNYSEVLNQLITLNGNCNSTCIMSVYGSTTVDLMLYNPDGGSCPSCPEINTGEILSGYILESDIDNLYCEEHGYCPLIDSGLDNTGVEWSALYINEIQHNSAPLINITIPEEFDWDYSGSEEEFNLEVKGYNVDTEYVDGLIRTQNFKPNSEDFSSILTGLVPLFVPGLAIILLLYFIFRFIKKVF